MVMSIFFIHTVAIYDYNVALEVAFAIVNHLNNNALGPKFVATGAIWQCLNQKKSVANFVAIKEQTKAMI